MKNNRRINISFNQAMNMLREDKNIILIDVKSREEYNRFHLKNSLNIPIENFKYIAPRLIEDKNEKIIIYCSTGIRSLAACEMLIDLGYINIYNIDGGTG